MAFVDELKIYAKAGTGGDGVVRWRQDKFEDRGGPAGGDGGRGADVYLEGVKDSNLLARYTHDTRFIAPDGENGAKKKMSGQDGVDMAIKLPVGSVITNLDTGEIYELLEEGQKIPILKGGKGGLGNEHFKSSVNTTPYESTPGKPGETANLLVELRLFADIGLVGYPNAGKSSFLNIVTNAKSKVGSYAFTTLDPHLGVLQEFIIADIPGIIEGASEGKGLGVKFLKHIKRTKMIAHMISFENEDMKKAYENIRKELENYDADLAKKDEVIILTKTDVTTPEEVTKALKEFKKINENTFVLSVYDDASVKEVSDGLVKILRK